MNFKYDKTFIMKEILWYVFSAASFQLKRVRVFHYPRNECTKVEDQDSNFKNMRTMYRISPNHIDYPSIFLYDKRKD
ncbi:hypothetical protein HanXRQr2_Chr01g0039041 [Helianthus annuus]|uniref:Uncharacterized protein n=1 Tax=Helianthus annuus TaxID=4232 RepID=A0A9K3JY89_HELAN|nr:hypothetical protein HanXRQr2_Chr01g0039041 [Helianthus annuus]